jgi:WD40 repeat protein
MRVTSLTVVDISRALGAIPGEFGALLRQKILEKKIDGDQLLEWLNSVEVTAEEPAVTDVFCKHSNLFGPFLDRVSLNRLCSTNSHICSCSRSVTPPWPQKLLHMGSAVRSVEFSPNGEHLACGSNDGIVRLWNGRNGSCTLLEGHTQLVRCVSFSPNGKILASGSYDHSIRLWKLDDQSHRLLEGRNGATNSIAFSPSGSSLASGSVGGEVRLWDIEDGRFVRTVTATLENVWSVALSLDGATLAVGGDDSVRLWDPEADDDSSSRSNIVETNGDPTCSLVHSPNGNFHASVGDDAVKTWHASDGSLEKTLGDHDVLSASFSPNGKLLASGDIDGSVRLWTANDENADCLAVSPHVHLREDEDGDDTEAPVNSVAFALNGQNLASGGQDGTIFLWDTRKFLQSSWQHIFMGQSCISRTWRIRADSLFIGRGESAVIHQKEQTAAQACLPRNVSTKHVTAHQVKANASFLFFTLTRCST